MSDIAGNYECVTKTPMGDQKSVLSVMPGADGTTWTGMNAGAMGSIEVANGRIEGNKLTWTMDMKVPMAMTLEGEATVEGDTLTGGVKAGMFGTMTMTGTRQG